MKATSFEAKASGATEHKRRLRQGNARALRMLAGLVLLALSPLALLFVALRIDYWLALRQLEKRLGPLTVEALKRAPIRDEDNAALGLLAAGGAVGLDEAESKDLASAVYSPDPPPDQALAKLVPLLVKNRRALELMAQALKRPDVDWGVDLAVGSDAQPPGLEPQGPLARLYYLRALIALRHGDFAEVERIAAVLGRHADALFANPIADGLRVGHGSERLQHRLLAAAAESEQLVDAARLRRMANALPTSDLKLAYENAVRREAVLLQSLSTKVVDQVTRNSRSSLKWFLRYRARFIVAGALRDHARILAAYDLPWTDHLALRPPTEPSGWLAKLRHMLVPEDFWDWPSSLRVVARERRFVAAGLTIRALRVDPELSGQVAADRITAEALDLKLAVASETDEALLLSDPDIESFQLTFPESYLTPRLISALRLERQGPLPSNRLMP